MRHIHTWSCFDGKISFKGVQSLVNTTIKHPNSTCQWTHTNLNVCSMYSGKPQQITTRAVWEYLLELNRLISLFTTLTFSKRDQGGICRAYTTWVGMIQREKIVFSPQRALQPMQLHKSSLPIEHIVSLMKVVEASNRFHFAVLIMALWPWRSPALLQQAFVTSRLRYRSRTQSLGPQGPELSPAAAARSGHAFCPPPSHLQ